MAEYARSPKEAREMGVETYRTGKPCKRGHVSERSLRHRSCIECERTRYQENKQEIRQRQREYYARNRDRIREQQSKYGKANRAALSKKHAEYVEKNRDSIISYRKEYYRANRDKIKARHAIYREKHREYLNEYRRKYHLRNREHHARLMREHYQENKASYFASFAKRRAAEIDRTLDVDGLDQEIFMIYQEARDMRDSGMDVHVDHVVPLQGKNVSGLHVPWNLEIIDAKENLRKGNSFSCYTETHY